MAPASLTEGSVLKSLFRLSVPIVAANFLQTAFQLTDTFWVGRLGADEVAALSLSFPVIFFLLSLGAGFSVSGTILVSQHTGKNNVDAVSHVCFQTLAVIIVLSLCLAAIAYAGVPYMIEAMTNHSEIASLAVSYLRISFVGLVFSYLYMMFQSLYRGVGDVKTPFYIVAVAVVLNFVLDPLLINGYGPFAAYGVDGAAYTTVATQGIAAGFGLFFLAKGKGAIKLDFSKAVIDFVQIKQIVRLGLPASAEQSARSLAMLVLTFLVASFGEVTLAAYGVGVRVLSFVIIPSLGFSMATSALVGQNIGAGKEERTKAIASKALWVIFLSLSLAGLLFYVFAEQTLEIFVPGEAQVIKEGARFIRMISLVFGFVGIQQVASGAMRGGGATLTSMFVALFSLWVTRFPFAYVASRHTFLNQDGIYLSFVVSSLLGAALSLYILKGNRWMSDVTSGVNKQEKKVLEESMTEEGSQS